MAEQRFEGDDPKDTVIGRGQWAETHLPIQSHGGETQLKPGSPPRSDDGGAELPREPAGEAAEPELPAPEKLPEASAADMAGLPELPTGDAEKLPEASAADLAGLPELPAGEAEPAEGAAPPTGVEESTEDPSAAKKTDFELPLDAEGHAASLVKEGEVVGEEEELPAGEEVVAEVDTSEAPELPAGEDVVGEEEELQVEAAAASAEMKLSEEYAEEEKKEKRGADSFSGTDLLASIVSGVLNGVEQLLKASQHKGLGAIETNFGKAFEGIPWSDKPWPDVAALDDYAQGAPAVDLTSQQGTRGAGGWGYGSRGKGNTLTDRAEPARRMPLGG